MIQFDLRIFSDGLVQPPTRCVFFVESFLRNLTRFMFNFPAIYIESHVTFTLETAGTKCGELEVLAGSAFKLKLFQAFRKKNN